MFYFPRHFWLGGGFLLPQLPLVFRLPCLLGEKLFSLPLFFLFLFLPLRPKRAASWSRKRYGLHVGVVLHLFHPLPPIDLLGSLGYRLSLLGFRLGSFGGFAFRFRNGAASPRFGCQAPCKGSPHVQRYEQANAQDGCLTRIRGGLPEELPFQFGKIHLLSGAQRAGSPVIDCGGEKLCLIRRIWLIGKHNQVRLALHGPLICLLVVSSGRQSEPDLLDPNRFWEGL